MSKVDNSQLPVTMVVKKSMSDEDPDTRREDSFESFSENTTLHGLRFIGDHEATARRRLIWAFLVLLCGGVFLFQVLDRINYYMQSPITVNFMVNYNNTLAFPAVTFCNQNSFRISEVYKKRMMPYIESLYNEDITVIPANHSKFFNMSLPLDELFVDLAHTKEDFIVKCRWANHDCSIDNFTTTLTSHGVCFTFNAVVRTEDALHVQSSGVERALRLILNTESYEKMKGPHGTAGIKMLATDQSRMASVDDVGIAISPGTHAFVGISVLSVNNLPPPYGRCGEIKLRSTDRYTPDSCRLECKTKYVTSRCKCRHFYMPDIYGKTPICDVKNYTTCLKQALLTFSDISDTLCKCPISCSYNIYEPSVSYASSSDMRDELKSSTQLDTIRSKFYASKEIRTRINFSGEKKHSSVPEEAINDLNSLEEILGRYFLNVQNNTRVISDLHKITQEAYQKRLSMYQFQMFVLEKSFISGRDAMEQNTFGLVCHAYNEFSNDLKNKIIYFLSVNHKESVEENVAYMLLKLSLQNKLDTLERAKANYTQLINAYRKGEMLSYVTYQDYSWSDHIAAVPRKLLQEALITKFEEPLTYLDVNDIDIIIQTIKSYEDYIKEVLVNNSTKFIESEVDGLSFEFCQACEQFLKKKKLFYNNVIDNPLNILKSRKKKVENMYQTYQRTADTITNSYTSMMNVIEEAPLFSSLKESLDYSMKYFNELPDNLTKYEVSSTLTDTGLTSTVGHIESLVLTLSNKLSTVEEAIPRLTNQTLDIWKALLLEPDNKAYDQHMGYAPFLQGYTDVEDDVLERFSQLTEDDDGAKNKPLDTKVVHTIKGLMNDLAEYKVSHNMDEQFYTNNFLRVDVFFRELRSEQIDQQKAYDEFALLCDVGGSMGLFIGGSVLTFFEIVDFLLMCFVHRVFRRS